MSETQNPYEKVVKKFLILLGLLVLSPIIFNIALSAKRIYKTGLGVYISYILLGIGVFLLIFTVFFGFKTIQTLLNTLFRNKN